MRHRTLRPILAALVGLAFVVATPERGASQAARQPAATRFAQLSQADVTEWLTYLSSDALQGREVFTEGYGMAADYIASHLREWGVKPLGDGGTYFQVAKLRSYRIARNSTVTVEVNGVSRTFKQGDHVSFPLLSGAKQRVRFDAVEFDGYGRTSGPLVRPAGDFAGRNVKGKLVVYLPGQSDGRNMGFGNSGDPDRGPDIALWTGAGGVIGYSSTEITPPVRRPADGNPPPNPGVTTSARVDAITPPLFSGDETFFDFLFSGSSTKFSTLREKADHNDPLPSIPLAGVRVTVEVDHTYEVLSTALSNNVVGLIEGTDPVLKSTYVFFGAHLDHVGYSKGNESKGIVRNPLETDRIWNGADDDGSGSVAVMAIAKAFATGPRPKRSVVVVWHTGEEGDLVRSYSMLGSTYMVSYPVVPLNAIQAEFNIDMIGRNRDNDESEANTLYVIGADRISTDLHNQIIDTNTSMTRPFKLDFEYNDASDPNVFYIRSDHYNYASKGIPIAFFFTGTHPDYHANSDSVEKIIFPKLIRVAQMIYEAGFSVADRTQDLERDNLGPRSGKGFQGPIPKSSN